MKKKSRKKTLQTVHPQKREHRIVFAMNEDEFNALNVYCKRYKIQTRSKLVRQVLLSHISKQFHEDYPTLF